MKRLWRSARQGKGKAAVRFFGALLFVSALFLFIPLSVQAQVTEQDILDAILGKRTFTNGQLVEMDLNGDGAVDAADMVYFSVTIASLTTSSCDN